MLVKSRPDCRPTSASPRRPPGCPPWCWQGVAAKRTRMKKMVQISFVARKITDSCFHSIIRIRDVT